MSDLQFQDFRLGGFDNPNFDIRGEEMIGASQDAGAFPAGNEPSRPKRNFFSFEYYQQYFDVNTDQVLNRIKCSLFPTLTSNFICDCIQPFPDLYGPFWICVTLIFSTSITAKLLKFFENSAKIDFHDYTNDFRFVTGASTLIIAYVALVPFCLYWFMWYRKVSIPYSYMELLCAYGYSLSIFIPVSVLTLVNLQEFRWALILVSSALSGTVLARSLWCSLKEDRNKLVAIAVVTVVLLCHFILAITFKQMYFKNTPSEQRTFYLPVEKKFEDQNINSSMAAALHAAPQKFERSWRTENVVHTSSITAQMNSKVQPTISTTVNEIDSKTNESINLTKMVEKKNDRNGGESLVNQTKVLIDSIRR